MLRNRAEIGQILSLLLIFLGSVFIFTAGGTYYLANNFLAQIPMNIDQTMNTVATGEEARILSICSLLGRHAAVFPAQVHGQTKLVSVSPANMHQVTLQMNNILIADSETIFNRDRRLYVRPGDLDETACDDGVLNGLVDMITVNRKTGQPIIRTDTSSAITMDPTRAPRIINDRTGFSYRFPPRLNMHAHYKYFDNITEQSVPVHFKAKEIIQDLPVWHYTQNVPERDLSELTLPGQDYSGKIFNSPPPLSILIKPASWWGVSPAGLNPVVRAALMMHRFGSVSRDIWVDPKSGIIVKMQEHIDETYHLRKDSPLEYTPVNRYRLTIYDGTQVSDTASISQAVSAAVSFTHRITLGTVTLPLILLLVGICVLVVGILLLIREVNWKKRVNKYAYEQQFGPLMTSQDY